MAAKQDDNTQFWDQVDHEIAECCVSSATKGGKLGSQPNCRDCPKNKRLDHHQHLILANEFKRQDLAVWNHLSLRGKLTLDHCFDFIKLCIPLCVRLESMHVSEHRPAERYPLCQKIGQTLPWFSKNVGSGWISEIRSMPDTEYVCVDCGYEWSVGCHKGVYSCPGGVCRDMWRVMSEEDRKCPWCDSDTREDEEGRLTCVGDKYECEWAVLKGQWQVVSEDVGGTCPQCQTEWWKTGEKGTCRCPKCGKTLKSECVCHSCLTSGKRGKKWWQICIHSARHVIYDKKEWIDCDVIMFDDGESEPVKLTAGRGGLVGGANTDDDKCHLYVYTCDSGLADKLEKMSERRKKGRIVRDVTDNDKCSGSSDDRSHESTANKCSESRDKNTSESKCSDSGSECSDSESEYFDIESEYFDIESKCSDSENKCSDSESECSDSESEYFDSESKCFDSESEYFDSESKCSDSESKCSDSERKCSDSESECSDSESECSDSESECSDSESSGDENDEVFPCVLIGYPHGRQCYVSLGKSHTRHDDGDWPGQTILYEISSCPGFSGGLVYRPGETYKYVIVPVHHHSGSLANKPHVGKCTWDVDYLKLFTNNSH